MNSHLAGSNSVRRPLVFGAAAFLLFLTSCMVGPEYRRPAAAVPPAFKEAAPAGWKAAQPDDGAGRGEWWSVYNDPRLDALEAQVSISNQNVLSAEASFREAQAAVRMARAELFPNFVASPSAVASEAGVTTGAKSVYTVPIAASYDPDVWGSIRRTARANSETAEASVAELEDARLLYQAELAADYFQIQGSDAEKQLLQATVTSYEQYLQLTQDRYKGGVAAMGDVTQAEAQLETARAELADRGVQRAQLEHAIAVLTGKPPYDMTIPDMPSQSPPPTFPIDLPSALLERRPDIAAAERRVAAANEQIGIAKSAFYPEMPLSATVGSQTRNIANLVTTPSRFWSLGLQFVENLFDAGKRRAEVKLTEAAYDATVANYRQTVLTAFQQVEDSLAQLRILADEADITDRAVKAAQQSLEISTTQYRGGLTNYLQVITAQTSTLQNQRRAVEILTRRKLASVSLIQGLGGGWNGEMNISD